MKALIYFGCIFGIWFFRVLGPNDCLEVVEVAVLYILFGRNSTGVCKCVWDISCGICYYYC